MKSNLMVLGFFRAQIRLGKIIKMKRNKMTSKLQLGELTKDEVISPDWNSNLARTRWINNQIATSSKPKRKLKMMTSNQHKRKKKMKLLDNQISGTSTSSMVISESDEPMGKRKRKVEKEMDLTSNQHKKKKKKMKLLGNSMFTTPILLTHGHRPKYITTTRNLSDLPPELLAEVLKTLPVKYVLRCRCVQKSWNSFIKTPTFITLHTDYHKNNHHCPKYLSFKAAYSNFMTIRFDDRQCQEYCRVKYLPDLPSCTWLAHSHGLFCVTSMSSLNPEKDGICLWNPLVQKYTTLPPSPFFGMFERLRLLAKAFGFLPQFNDYVVVYLMQPHPKCCPLKPHLVKIAIYSLNNNSWKTVSQDYFFKGTINMDRSVFVNGVAYWLGSKLENCEVLVCFDTKNDTLREMLLPDWVEAPWIGIHPFGQSIAYFVEDERAARFEMWVLKGDSIDEFFWEKKMSIGVNELFRTQVLGLRNNGEPIVFSFYDLLSYNLDSHEASDFVDSWNCWDDFSYYDYGMAPPFSVSPFVESLALLNLD